MAQLDSYASGESSARRVLKDRRTEGRYSSASEVRLLRALADQEPVQRPRPRPVSGDLQLNKHKPLSAPDSSRGTHGRVVS